MAAAAAGVQVIFVLRATITAIITASRSRTITARVRAHVSFVRHFRRLLLVVDL
jgi:hypothetical protein